MKNKKLAVVTALCATAVSVLVCVVGTYSAIEKIQLKKYKSIPLSLSENFTLTAHTGCSATEDNSLESIEVGVQNGADIVEFDLNFDKSGMPVLSHDEPKGNEVTLDEAFKKLSEYPHLKANVDVKNTANLKAVRFLAEKNGVLQQIFYTGIEEKDVEAVKTQTPEIPYYLNMDVLSGKKHTEEYLMSLVQKVKACKAIGINFNKKNASKDLVDTFHENGLLVSIWTVNDEVDMYRILSYSPDNITTRNPDLLSQILPR